MHNSKSVRKKEMDDDTTTPPFKPPRKVLREIQPHNFKSESSSSSEEESTMDLAAEEWEAIVRDEVKEWLSLHGTKLFALESSKFLAAEAKRKNIRSIR